LMNRKLLPQMSPSRPNSSQSLRVLVDVIGGRLVGGSGAILAGCELVGLVKYANAFRSRGSPR
jgi:hypothetical protein